MDVHIGSPSQSHVPEDPHDLGHSHGTSPTIPHPQGAPRPRSERTGWFVDSGRDERGPTSTLESPCDPPQRLTVGHSDSWFHTP